MMGRLVDLDDLTDAAGVAELLGLSHRTSVGIYRHRYDDFPEPVIDLGPGRPHLWLRSEVDTWHTNRPRRPAAPPARDEPTPGLKPLQALMLRAVADLAHEGPPTAHTLACTIWHDAGWPGANARKTAGILRGLLRRGLVHQPRHYRWSLTAAGNDALHAEPPAVACQRCGTTKTFPPSGGRTYEYPPGYADSPDSVTCRVSGHDWPDL